MLDKRASKLAVYDFINDRFRSIKQDGVIQRMSTENWFQILLPIARFYAFSAYWSGFSSFASLFHFMLKSEIIKFSIFVTGSVMKNYNASILY